MARIRTIKPEFFTSEDIVSLSPMARLLYIALWCEADKEGRMVWKPTTFKLRYLPGDSCDVNALCAELVDGGLVHLYGEGYAVIPAFRAHQHINPRESESQLPEPGATATRKARVGTREDASARVNSRIDPQVGREGKGKEGNEEKTGLRPARKCPPDFQPAEPEAWVAENCPGLNWERETAKFRDHTFKNAISDWGGAWRNWMRRAAEDSPKPTASQSFRERDDAAKRATALKWMGSAAPASLRGDVIEMEAPDAARISLG